MEIFESVTVIGTRHFDDSSSSSESEVKELNAKVIVQSNPT